MSSTAVGTGGPPPWRLAARNAGRTRPRRMSVRRRARARGDVPVLALDARRLAGLPCAAPHAPHVEVAVARAAPPRRRPRERLRRVGGEAWRGGGWREGKARGVSERHATTGRARAGGDNPRLRASTARPRGARGDRARGWFRAHLRAETVAAMGRQRISALFMVGRSARAWRRDGECLSQQKGCPGRPQYWSARGGCPAAARVCRAGLRVDPNFSGDRVRDATWPPPPPPRRALTPPRALRPPRDVRPRPSRPRPSAPSPPPPAPLTVPRRASLRKVRFGNTDMMVTEVCGGTMTWGSFNADSGRARAARQAVVPGRNFIDTAELYPVAWNYGATTERWIGNWPAKRATGRCGGDPICTSPPR